MLSSTELARAVRAVPFTGQIPASLCKAQAYDGPCCPRMRPCSAFLVLGNQKMTAMKPLQRTTGKMPFGWPKVPPASLMLSRLNAAGWSAQKCHRPAQHTEDSNSFLAKTTALMHERKSGWTCPRVGPPGTQAPDVCMRVLSLHSSFGIKAVMMGTLFPLASPRGAPAVSRPPL